MKCKRWDITKDDRTIGNDARDFDVICVTNNKQKHNDAIDLPGRCVAVGISRCRWDITVSIDQCSGGVQTDQPETALGSLQAASAQYPD